MLYIFEYSHAGSVVEKFEMDFPDKRCANFHANFLRKSQSIFDTRILKVYRKRDNLRYQNRVFSQKEAHFIIEFMLNHRVKHLKTTEILRKICIEMDKMKVEK